MRSDIIVKVTESGDVFHIIDQVTRELRMVVGEANLGPNEVVFRRDKNPPITRRYKINKKHVKKYGVLIDNEEAE